MTFVRGAFPYLVDTSKASGGGDVAGVRFHILKVVESTVSLEESIATLNLVVGDCGEQQSQSNCNATGPRIYEPVIVNGVRVQPFEGWFEVGDGMMTHVFIHTLRPHTQWNTESRPVHHTTVSVFVSVMAIQEAMFATCLMW